MGLIHQHHGGKGLRQVQNFRQGSQVPIHTKHRVREDQAAAIVGTVALEPIAQILQVAMPIVHHRGSTEFGSG